MPKSVLKEKDKEKKESELTEELDRLVKELEDVKNNKMTSEDQLEKIDKIITEEKDLIQAHFFSLVHSAYLARCAIESLNSVGLSLFSAMHNDLDLDYKVNEIFKWTNKLARQFFYIENKKESEYSAVYDVLRARLSDGDLKNILNNFNNILMWVEKNKKNLPYLSVFQKVKNQLELCNKSINFITEESEKLKKLEIDKTLLEKNKNDYLDLQKEISIQIEENKQWLDEIQVLKDDFVYIEKKVIEKKEAVVNEVKIDEDFIMVESKVKKTNYSLNFFSAKEWVRTRQSVELSNEIAKSDPSPFSLRH